MKPSLTLIAYRLETPHQATIATDSFGPGASGATGNIPLDNLPKGSKERGNQLFEFLFPKNSELRELFRSCVSYARLSKKVIRFRLEFSKNVPLWLQELDWEILFDQRDGDWLCKQRGIWFSRFPIVGEPGGHPVAEKPKLLIAIADPKNSRDKGVSPIGYQNFLDHTIQCLAPLKDKLDWQILKPPVTLNRLQEILWSSQKTQMLHLVAHGSPGLILLENSKRDGQIISSDEFGRLINRDPNLRLVTLISCHGAVNPIERTFEGMASSLVNQGVPAVVAMRRSISFSSAHSFTAKYYHWLADKPIIDRAVNYTRAGLYHEEAREWAAPALFMRLKNGQLWEMPNELDEPASQSRPESLEFTDPKLPPISKKAMFKGLPPIVAPIFISRKGGDSERYSQSAVSHQENSKSGQSLRNQNPNISEGKWNSNGEPQYHRQTLSRRPDLVQTSPPPIESRYFSQANVFKVMDELRQGNTVTLVFDLDGNGPKLLVFSLDGSDPSGQSVLISEADSEKVKARCSMGDLREICKDFEGDVVSSAERLFGDPEFQHTKSEQNPSPYSVNSRGRSTEESEETDEDQESENGENILDGWENPTVDLSGDQQNPNGSVIEEIEQSDEGTDGVIQTDDVDGCSLQSDDSNTDDFDTDVDMDPIFFS